ncbi:MAG TPA: anti-sigma factor, partial [Casimicrobiaceae bacterium]|nr:anti-sigma factor [Casimicrobiaceae bacterium]
MTPATDDDLHAYADGQLPEVRRLAFEQAMARDSALAAEVAEVRRQNAALRGALDEWLAEPVPQRLLDAARPPARGATWRRLLAPIAASAATLVIGLAGGWY